MDSGSSLEESMWQLRLESSEPPYPERPGEPDCSYYVRTGTCGYGDRCRFNHPRDIAVAGGGRSGGVVYPERVGQPACQFFLKTGTCKYGASCKYDHPRQGARSAQLVPLNYYGYPLRPGGKECSYYMRMGLCKFGSTCKFHHPEPGGAPVSSPATAFYPTVQTPVFPSPYMQLPPYGSMMISTGVVPVPGWSYPPTVSPALSPGGQHSLPAYPGTYTTVSSHAGPSSSSQKEQAFPERPGQPECQYYMRTGDCKFGPTCKYHHPSEWSIPRTTDCVLSPVGLPLRPGAMPCVFYAQHGVCKFGPSCKFDHSMGVLSYSPSASSLADMPVAPYPVGFSVATLAPSSSSSSSSELRPDFISNRDSYHTQVSLTESGSIGSMFSKSGYVPPQSLVPYYTPSGSGGGGSSSSSMSQGGELSSSS